MLRSILPFVVLLLAAGPLAPLARAADPASLTFAKDVQPLLVKYCHDCHGDDAHKGDVSLAPFADDAAVQSDTKLWRNVLTQVGEHTMPPAKKRQPTQAERDVLVDYITYRLNNLDLSKIKKDPGRVTIRRLNRVEYNNTIRDLLGVYTNPADAFPADGGGGGGFDNNADTLFVPPVLMEQYLAAAGEVLAKADPRRLVTTPVETAKSPGEAARANVQDFARRAFRRPVTAAEVDRYTRLFARAYDKRAGLPKGVDPFVASLRLAYKAVLVSPHFLFRVEQDRPGTEAYPLNDFEVASRLSYFVWSSMPDAELFKLAEEGKLRDDAVIDQQVRRMLKDPKSRYLAEQFGGQWLGFNALHTTASPDRTKFPAYTAEVRDGFYAQAIEFVDSVFREDRPLHTLIDSDYTFANQAVARHYEIPKIRGEEMRRIPLGDDRTRGGVLGLGAVHVVTSYPLRTSPVLRGRWVLETIMGAAPPPPPPDVPELPKDDAPTNGLTFRQQLEKHRQDPNCASCHARMDPLGFGMENFDAIGRFRKQQDGRPVDAVGTLSTGESFTGPNELKRILMRKKDDFARNVTERMLSYALGRGLETYDQPAVKRITDALAKSDHKAGTLVSEIARSYPFRWRRN